MESQWQSTNQRKSSDECAFDDLSSPTFEQEQHIDIESLTESNDSSLLSLSSLANSRDTSHSNQDSQLAPIYHYFMNIAVLASKKRKNRKHQAGACIVNNNNKVVGVGNYTDHVTIKGELLCWLKSAYSKNDYLQHAEMNAIFSREQSLNDCTLFVTTFPCLECAKLITNSGIRHVVYMHDDDCDCCQSLSQESIEAIKLLFRLARVDFTRLE